MITKTEYFQLRLTPEERAAFAELASLKHCDVSTAVVQAVYEARARARQEEQLTAAWQKAQETK